MSSRTKLNSQIVDCFISKLFRAETCVDLSCPCGVHTVHVPYKSTYSKVTDVNVNHETQSIVYCLIWILAVLLCA